MFTNYFSSVPVKELLSPDRGRCVKGTSRTPSEGYDLYCSWRAMLDSRHRQIGQELLLTPSCRLWFASLVSTEAQPWFQGTFLFAGQYLHFSSWKVCLWDTFQALLANTSGNLSSHYITRHCKGYSLWAKIKHLENSSLESFVTLTSFCQSVLGWFESLGHTIYRGHWNNIFNSKHLSEKWRMIRKRITGM